MPINQLFPEDPGYEYSSPMSLVPVRRKIVPYAPGKGPNELALPGLARTIGNDLWMALTAPANALTGQYTEAELPQVAAQVAGGLGLLGVGMPAPGGAARIFAGANASSAPTKGLAKAVGLESSQAASGTPASAAAVNIWRETGWFRGPDGKWRFEIPDEDFRFKDGDRDLVNPKQMWPGEEIEPHFPEDASATVKLGDVIHHPKLFEAYPELKDISVKSLPILNRLMGTKGGYDELSGSLYIGSGKPVDMAQTILHELQHAVQDIEDFSMGGSPQQFLPKDFDETYNAAVEKVNKMDQEISKKGANPFSIRSYIDYTENPYYNLSTDRLGGQLVSDRSKLADDFYENYVKAYKEVRGLRDQKREAFEKYQNIAGEVEARSTESRYELNERKLAPWLMEGYPPMSKQTLQPSRRRAAMPPPPALSFEPVEHDPFAGTKDYVLDYVEHNPFAGGKE